MDKQLSVKGLVHVGQKFWVPRRNQWVTVGSVGRTYASITCDGVNWWADGAKLAVDANGNLYVKDHRGDSLGSVYTDKEAYEADKALGQEWLCFYRKVSRQWGRPSSITLEQIKQMTAWCGLEEARSTEQK